MDESGSDYLVDRPIVYHKRWYMVFVLWWLNVTNGMLWISYANIADTTAHTFGTTISNINWFSLVFPLFTIVLCLPSFWVLDRMGIRISFTACSLLNLLAATLRLLCSYDTIFIDIRFPLAMVGQCIGAIAQPLAMFSPARLASVWFQPSQRVTATTLSALGNPFGVLLGSLLPPYIVDKNSQGFINLAILLFAISLVGAIITVLGICHSKPPHPPAMSAERPSSRPFFSQLRLCLTNLNFVVLAISFGVALGLFTALSTLLEQILCPYGYEPKFAGLCGALLIGCGLLGALVSGVVADKTKALTEIVQICLVLATFGIIAFSIFTIFSGMEGPIIVSVCWIGLFGVALYSVSFELAAETTFPVSENISTGLLVVSGQIFSVIFILLSMVLMRPTTAVTWTVICSGILDKSLWLFNMVMSGCAVLAASAILLFFSAQYRRQMTDEALISAQEDYGRDVTVSVSE